MTGKHGTRSGLKWAFIGFILGCGFGILLGVTGLMERPPITGNIAQQGGADIGFVLAFGIIFGVIGLLFSKFGRKG